MFQFFFQQDHRLLEEITFSTAGAIVCGHGQSPHIRNIRDARCAGEDGVEQGLAEISTLAGSHVMEEGFFVDHL